MSSVDLPERRVYNLSRDLYAISESLIEKAYAPTLSADCIRLARLAERCRAASFLLEALAESMSDASDFARRFDVTIDGGRE